MLESLTKHVCAALQANLAGRATPISVAAALPWRWFNDLCRTRTGNGYGPNPLSYAEIEAYARLYRWPLEPRHVDLILAMDRVWLERARQNISAGTGTNVPMGPGQEMSPEAFDAVFG